LFNTPKKKKGGSCRPPGQSPAKKEREKKLRIILKGRPRFFFKKMIKIFQVLEKILEKNWKKRSKKKNKKR